MESPSFFSLSQKNLLPIRVIGLCFLLTFLIIAACRKDQSAGSELSETSISDLKEWYNGQKSKSLAVKSHLPGLSPNWAMVNSFEDNKGNKVYEIEVNNPNRVFTADKQVNKSKYLDYEKRNLFRLVLVQDKKTGAVSGAYMNIVAEDINQNLKRIHYKNAPGFNGTIQYYNIDGSYDTGWHYTKGKIDNKFTNVARITTRAATEAICITIPTYQTICAGPDDVDAVCTTTQIEDQMECIEEGGSSGGGDSGDGGFGGGGGSGSGTGGDNPTTSTNPEDPCNQKRTISANAKKPIIADQNAKILAKTSPDGTEFGTERNLTTPSLNAPYINTAVRTDGKDSNFEPKFTWNATDGYTIGVAHGHPGSSAPSPADAVWLISNINNSELRAGGDEAKAFFKANISNTIITADATYVITVRSWTALESVYWEFNKDKEAFNNRYIDLARRNGNSTEYAFLALFANALYLYKAPASSTEFEPLELKLNDTSDIVPSPCL